MIKGAGTQKWWEKLVSHTVPFSAQNQIREKDYIKEMKLCVVAVGPPALRSSIQPAASAFLGLGLPLLYNLPWLPSLRSIGPVALEKAPRR